jgi:hypothetical protein
LSFRACEESLVVRATDERFLGVPRNAIVSETGGFAMLELAMDLQRQV